MRLSLSCGSSERHPMTVPRRVTSWLITGLVIGLFAGGCSSGDSASEQIAPADTPQPESPLQILIVHSFGPELASVQQMNAVITREFAEYGYSAEMGNLDLKSYYMNAQRAATEGEFER